VEGTFALKNLRSSTFLKRLIMAKINSIEKWVLSYTDVRAIWQKQTNLKYIPPLTKTFQCCNLFAETQAQSQKR
jgi:hypothetical protein